MEAHEVAERPVFTLAGETYRWGDVVEAARLRGDWGELEEATRRRLACLRRLTASGEEVAKDELAAAAARFRYARSLLSGEEMEAWLARWRLTIPEWHDFVRRELLEERWAAELEETIERFPVGEEEVEAVLRVDAVCSGFLERAAERLAGDAAMAGGQTETLEQIQRAADRARAAAATDEAIEREVAAHALEWLRVEGELLELPGQDAAREAALCVRTDGRPLAEVAADCGTATRRLRVYVGEAEGELGSSLLAAREGELLGPFASNGGYALLLVQAKVRPAPTDADVRRKAAERVVAREVERAIRERVEWHERL